MVGADAGAGRLAGRGSTLGLAVSAASTGEAALIMKRIAAAFNDFSKVRSSAAAIVRNESLKRQRTFGSAHFQACRNETNLETPLCSCGVVESANERVQDSIWMMPEKSRPALPLLAYTW